MATGYQIDRLLIATLTWLALTGAARAQFDLALETIAGGFTQPLFVTHAGDGSGRRFVVEKGGTIRIVEASGLVRPDPFLTRSVAAGGEGGLLGLAFHPAYPANGLFFINYTIMLNGQLTTRLSRLRVGDQPDRADAASEVVLIELAQPYDNHNAGMLAFGPDGYLYMATGDGGGTGDPLGNAQNRATLHGNILRMDVDQAAGGLQYSIPPGNPFAGNAQGWREEIFAWGFRNPWRFSFDRQWGVLLAADVGQSSWEEVNIVQPGGNYGWNRMEGAHCYPPGSSCDPTGLILPLHEYPRANGNISVTGGYVYRGRKYPRMNGHYFFGDFGSGRIWSLAPTGPAQWSGQSTQRLDTPGRFSSFGEDEAGEIYVCDYSGGAIYRLTDPAGATGANHWRQYR